MREDEKGLVEVPLVDAGERGPDTALTSFKSRLQEEEEPKREREREREREKETKKSKEATLAGTERLRLAN